MSPARAFLRSLCSKSRSFPYVLVPAALFLSIAVPARGDACRIAKPHTPDPAEDAYLNGKFAEAETLYRQAISGHPGDPALTTGLVRALLREEKVSDAVAAAKSALAAAPTSAAFLTSMAEVQYRQGLIVESGQSAAAAYDADICYARVHLIRARLARLNSMYAIENKEIGLAHTLDPYDPDIQDEWIGTLPLQQRINELKKYLGAPNGFDDESRHNAELYLDNLEKRIATPKRSCHLVSTDASTKIPLVSIIGDQLHPRSWALMTKFNNADAELEVDTGASGLYISRRVAEKAGLQPLARSQVYGFGDNGPQGGFTAYVDSIRVGSLEFRDCLVEVSDRKGLGDADGLVGTDIFADFVVSINFPRRNIELSTLPAHPGETPSPASLRTETQGQDGPAEDAPEGQESATDAKKAQAATGPTDRYIAPEMASWFPVFRVGHDLILRTGIDKKISKLFLIDTGSEATILSIPAASEIRPVFKDPQKRLFGVDGEVKRVYSAGVFTLQFADKIQETDNVFIVDTSNITKEAGTEISGVLGLEQLKFLTVRIDYRDGLVKFDFDPATAERNR